jgi:hypothetical protein
VAWNTNLTNWLSGGARSREQNETRADWNEVEALWRRSPLAENDTSALAVEIVQEAIAKAPRVPSTAFLVSLCITTEVLLDAEDIALVEADWELFDRDIEVAVETRTMLARRRRWASDYPRMMRAFRRQLVDGYLDLFTLLPESCFAAEQGEALFEVPLLELIDDPVEVVRRIVVIPYSDDTLRFDIFHKLRKWMEIRLVTASGFPAFSDAREVAQKLKGPSEQKGKSAGELVSMYLDGTPFEDVLNEPVGFSIPDEARFEHCHIVGGTGHGKTQLLQRMIHADLVAAQTDGRSVVVVDSQGDLINKLVRLALFSQSTPDSLFDRLILIDPSDVEFPAALNLFDAHLDRVREYRPVDRERVLNGVVELYETFFGALLGAELTQKQGVIFRYLARLMMNIPGATIHTLMQLMEDARPFKSYMDTLDGSARYFFEREFFDPSFSATKKQILKRLWGVLSTPAFERMFAQKENKLDLFAAMNRGSIILVNTAKDLLKDEGSALFGRFFVSLISQAALERSTVPESERSPTFVYIDEAQEYFDDKIETILSQARKYRVGITLAHQTLDQLSPRLRAAFLANTSLKCAGGVSSRDARALAPELHTTSEFIESQRRRGDRTEFAVWLKNRTEHALRLTVPLGFLEREPTALDDDYDILIDQNRARYCGTLDDVLTMEFAPRVKPSPQKPLSERTTSSPTEPEEVTDPPAIVEQVATPDPVETPPPSPHRPQRPPLVLRELGKGGPKHRYLQSLVKELAQQHGFRATVEAPLPGGSGQIDVLLEQGSIKVAFEVSVTTPVEAERENVRKCLDAGFARVALVLAKSRTTQGRYRTMIFEGLSPEERERVSFLAPEEVPDYIAALAPAPAPSESMVKGYRVKVSHTSVSPDEARIRRDVLAKLVVKSLKRQAG